uniref:Uncharacterized protein n=1 Tax=Klebsiella pneumoniae TaxID=573 RepID=A0A2P1BPC8_KLEPN|nr:hypothetical protein [Klebsiella pneumoniae]
MSACRHRRCGAIRMSPCRLRVHPARFPGLLGEHNLCYRRAVCWLCRAFTLARQPQGWSSLAPPSPDKAVAGLPLPPAPLHPAPSLRSVALFLRLSRCDICFRFSPGGRKTGRETLYSTSCIATGCAVPSL